MRYDTMPYDPHALFGLNGRIRDGAMGRFAAERQMTPGRPRKKNKETATDSATSEKGEEA